MIQLLAFSKGTCPHTELENLPISTLLNEVKRLHDIAYELGIEERKEMTRGKYINIFRKRN